MLVSELPGVVSEIKEKIIRLYEGNIQAHFSLLAATKYENLE